MSKSVTDFINSCGLEVITETSTELILYCPFHHNIDTPSFSINKRNGLWQCFNPSCGKSGRFSELTKVLKGKEYSLREDLSYSEVASVWGVKSEDNNKSMSVRNIKIDYDDSSQVEKLRYLIDRGFSVDTLEYFRVGFSKKRNRIVIPVFDTQYVIVGFIGRAIEDSPMKYLYSRGFQRRFSLFNIQNTLTYDTIIVAEGSLDAMKIHQAGFHNVVATLGAKLSPEQGDMLNRYFDNIIIFADNDAAGSELKSAIIDRCPRKGIRVVEYPEGIKDPGEMSEEQIINCIEKSQDGIQNLFDLIA